MRRTMPRRRSEEGGKEEGWMVHRLRLSYATEFPLYALPAAGRCGTIARIRNRAVVARRCSASGVLGSGVLGETRSASVWGRERVSAAAVIGAVIARWFGAIAVLGETPFQHQGVHKICVSAAHATVVARRYDAIGVAIVRSVAGSVPSGSRFITLAARAGCYPRGHPSIQPAPRSQPFNEPSSTLSKQPASNPPASPQVR